MRAITRDKALDLIESIGQAHAVHVSHIYGQEVFAIRHRRSDVITCKGTRGAPNMLGFRFPIVINTRASCSARRPGFPINKNIGLRRHAPIGINRSLAHMSAAAYAVRSDDLGRPRAKQPLDIRRIERLYQHDDAAHASFGSQARDGLSHIFSIKQGCRDNGSATARRKRPSHRHQPV